MQAYATRTRISSHETGRHWPGSTSQDGPTLEIFEYEPVALGVAPAVNRPGLAHIAFAVDSVEAAVREVVSAGGSAVGEVTELTTATGARVTACYVTDPEGSIIEVQSWEPPAQS